MPHVATRLEAFTESVIREMTRVANQYGAINLAQGFPDFDPPPALVSAAHQTLDEGYHQYAITWGSPRFREALAQKQSRYMNLAIDPHTHITVTCGSTEAMLAAMMTVCNPGERVAIFSPFYENYGPDVVLAGAQPLFVPLHPPAYNFDPDELTAIVRRGVKALVLCNPSNPSGKVFTPEELQFIADLSQEHDFFVLTDEVYEHIIYEPHHHTYIASLPGMFTRTLSCSSLSKTYAITGWRLGYIIASAELTTGVRKVHDFLTVGAPAPLQEAAAEALGFPDTYYQELQADYTRRRDLFLAALGQTGLDYAAPQGAYYILADVSPLGFADDTACCHWLAREIGVAAVPGSSFFHEPVNHLIRFNFAKREQTLIQVGERLARLQERI